MVIGNKSDLKAEQRQVATLEGKTLADEFKCGFTEASARLNHNVSKAFEQMIAEIEKSHTSNEPTGGNRCQLM